VKLSHCRQSWCMIKAAKLFSRCWRSKIAISDSTLVLGIIHILCCETMQMLYCYCKCSILASSFSSFSIFPPFPCAQFFSMETSVNDLKLQHKLENGLSSHCDIFQNLTQGYEITFHWIENKRRHPCFSEKCCHLTAVAVTECALGQIGGSRPNSSSSSTDEYEIPYDGPTVPVDPDICRQNAYTLRDLSARYCGTVQCRAVSCGPTWCAVRMTRVI